jgi:hypothetical protein
MMTCFDPCWSRGSAPSPSRPGCHAVSPLSATVLANLGYYCPPPARARNRNWRTAAEGPEEMSGKDKSTDQGLSAAERTNLRAREAQEAIAEHEDARQALQENRERLREERRIREAAQGPMLAPTPELPDDTPIDRVIVSTRIQNAPSSRPKNRWRSARGIGRKLDQPSGFRKRLAFGSP